MLVTLRLRRILPAQPTSISTTIDEGSGTATRLRLVPATTTEVPSIGSSNGSKTVTVSRVAVFEKSALNNAFTVFHTNSGTELVAIEPTTGAGTVIGSLDNGIFAVDGLAFDYSTDTLYGLGARLGVNGAEVFSISTSTGETTLANVTLGFNNFPLGGLTFIPAIVPEPGSIALLGGLCVATSFRRRRSCI